MKSEFAFWLLFFFFLPIFTRNDTMGSGESVIVEKIVLTKVDLNN